MNNFETINTEYIRASRTIETVRVSNKNSSALYFIYNYEGVSFRVFKSHIELTKFFLNESENYVHFNKEYAVDDFLAKVKIAA